MKKEFLIKVIETKNIELYANHSTYNAGDAGLDLFITENVTIKGNETVIVDLGIKCQSRSISFNMYNWICGKFFKYHSYFLFPRSSISKTPLIMKNSIGLIDKGYVGNLKIALYNTSNDDFILERGQRYVQLVNSDLSDAKIRLVDSQRSTQRGDGGFGSTSN